MKETNREPTRAIKSGAKLRPCSCKHAWQDMHYGKGMRVHTMGKGANANQIVLRCAVCEKEIIE